MFLAVLVIGLLLPSTSWADDVTCEEMLPEPIDSSICDDIRSAMFIFRYAIRDIDAEVRNIWCFFTGNRSCRWVVIKNPYLLEGFRL